MGKRQKLGWLLMQGYRTVSLPPIITWYAKGREFKGRTDNYTLDLYRGKGFVLDKKFLDPSLWNALEYGQHQTTLEAAQPQRGASPLAREVIKVMAGRDAWEGTASELLGLVNSGMRGIPKDAKWFSTKVVDPDTLDMLGAHGITVERKRTKARRLLRLTKFTQ